MVHEKHYDNRFFAGLRRRISGGEGRSICLFGNLCPQGVQHFQAGDGLGRALGCDADKQILDQAERSCMQTEGTCGPR